MPNKVVVISMLAAAGAISAVVYSVMSGDDDLAPMTAPTADMREQSTNTIAHRWRWENLTNDDPEQSAAEGSKVNKPRRGVPYDAVEVYKILQSIKLDENGRVVPDQTALQALEKGFHDLGPNMSSETMSGLQNLIRKGLPGPAGEEAARIFENYYQYRLAEAEFESLRATQASQMPATEHYSQLAQLRRRYLGEEVADKLFAIEDTQARHMLAAIAIQQDANLSPEEKQAKQEALQVQLNERLLALGHLEPEEAAADKVRRLREQGASKADVYSTREAMLGTQTALELSAADREEAQWQSRFNGYWQARRYVMQAGLDEAERERQIEELLNAYFSPEERERARITSLDWQAQDRK